MHSNVQHILCCVFCFVCLPLVSRVPNAISLFGLYILVLAVFPCCCRFTWSYEEFLPHLIRYLFFSKTLENVDIESYLLYWGFESHFSRAHSSDKESLARELILSDRFPNKDSDKHKLNLMVDSIT